MVFFHLFLSIAYNLPFMYCVWSSLTKSDIKMSNSLFFKPFKPLVDHSSSLSEIDELISAKRYEAAMKLAVDLRNLSLEGLHYFQTYDWLMLMTVITLGYTGWMIVLALHVLQCYSSLSGDLSRKGHLSVQKRHSRKVMQILHFDKLYTLTCLAAMFLGYS